MEVERTVTFPIEKAMTGVPRSAQLRSVSRFGLSSVTIVFDDGTDIWFARQLVFERVRQAGELPPSAGVPELAPLSTGLGTIYSSSSSPSSTRPCSCAPSSTGRSCPKLQAVPGVIEINTFGGELKQYRCASTEAPAGARADAQRRARRAARRERQRRRRLRRAQRRVVHHSRSGHVPAKRTSARSSSGPRRASRRSSSSTWPRRVGAALRYGVVTHNGEREAVSGLVMMLRARTAATSSRGQARWRRFSRTAARREHRGDLRPRRLRRAHAADRGREPVEGAAHRTIVSRSCSGPSAARSRSRSGFRRRWRSRCSACTFPRDRRPDEPRRHRLRLPRRRANRRSRGGDRGDRGAQARGCGARPCVREVARQGGVAGRVRGRDHHARVHPAAHARRRRGQDVPAMAITMACALVGGARLRGGVFPGLLVAFVPPAKDHGRSGSRRSRALRAHRAGAPAPALADRRRARSASSSSRRWLFMAPAPSSCRASSRVTRGRDAARAQHLARRGAQARPRREKCSARFPRCVSRSARAGARRSRSTPVGNDNTEYWCRSSRARSGRTRADLDELSDLFKNAIEAEVPGDLRLRLAADRGSHQRAHRRLARRRARSRYSAPTWTGSWRTPNRSATRCATSRARATCKSSACWAADDYGDGRPRALGALRRR